MTRRPVSIIDVDGVLADYVRGVSELARKWDPSLAARDAGNAAGDAYAEWPIAGPGLEAALAEIATSRTFWRELQRIPSQREIDALCAMDGDKYYVTARPGVDVKIQTEDWLRANLSYVANPTVVVVRGLGTKVNVANAIGATHVIDDRVEALAAYLGRGDADLQVFGRRWPANAHWLGRVHWVKSLIPFTQAVNGG